MTIKPKLTKEIERIIDGGGAVKADSEEADTVRISLAIPKSLSELIDQKRKLRIDKITKTRWIIEAILEKLKNDN
jgi:hypothetical protein